MTNWRLILFHILVTEYESILIALVNGVIFELLNKNLTGMSYRSHKIK